MPTQYDPVPSLREFRRTLAIVVLGFGLLLALSWTIDATLPRDTVGAVAGVQTGANG